MTSISAYVPCFNARATLRRAVESVLAQTIRPAEVVVIDDGSTDRSADEIRDLDVRLVTLPRNLGRGAARARAMSEARHDLVLSCDATNVLEPAFVAKALPWFDNPQLAAVFGRITQAAAANVAERWRGRHLFKIAGSHEPAGRMSLSTWGTMVRASAVRGVGGYDLSLRHTEDGELGSRLLAAGHDVVYDPKLEVLSIAPNTLPEVLERHWRWYAGTHPAVNWREYKKSIAHSVKCMAMDDLRAGDPLSVPVSLLTPHYHLIRTLLHG